MVKAISGVHTVRFKNELVRNITIKLGYANAKVSRLMTRHAPANSGRFTNATIPHVLVPGVTNLTAQIKRKSPLVNVLVATLE